jgi:carbonic anhydrase
MDKRFALVLILLVCAWGNAPAHAQIVAAAAGVDADDFAYTGDKGPGFWPELHDKHGKDFSACAPSPSARQSPIDINTVVEDPGLGPLDVRFVQAPFIIKNLGYTLQATPAFGGSLTLDGRSYSLVQFHFHTLSEHTVAGRHGVMELHLVFKHSDTDFAVIGELYRVGKPNAFLKTLIEAGLPEKTTSPEVTAMPNLEKALTDASQYFTYPGSLTTPPCSPVVTWLVLKQWAELSPEQYEAFRKILGNDFRPLQNSNGRAVHATVRRWPFDVGQPSTTP